MTHKHDFESLVKSAGIPTTEDEFKTAWETEAAAQGSVFSNKGQYSPLWRIITRLITLPALWIVQLLVNEILPQTFVKTATGIFLDILAWAFGVERKAAAKTQGIVRFTRSDTVGTLDVPVGTLIQSPPINGVTFTLVTMSAATFVDGNATLDVPVEAQEPGAAFNLAPGYYAILPMPVPGVATASNPADWITRAGSDVETDDELRSRVRNQFSATNQWHTDAVYRSIIAEFPGVSVDNIFFEHNAPRGPGTANAYVMFETGNPDGPFIASIQASITDAGNHGHGDDLLVFAVPEVQHNISATYWTVPNLSLEQKAQLHTDIGNFIRAAFRQNTQYSPTKTRPYTRFSFSRLAQELHAQFPSLYSLDFVQADLTPGLNIPRLQTLTLTEGS